MVSTPRGVKTTASPRSERFYSKKSRTSTCSLDKLWFYIIYIMGCTTKHAHTHDDAVHRNSN